MTLAHVTLVKGNLALVPLAAGHREPLRAACAADSEIWAMFPYSMAGEAFDPAFEAMIGTPGRLPYAVVADGIVGGCTSYLHDAANCAVEVGGTYIVPALRGTGINRRMKALLIAHAFGSGIGRVEFRVDARNLRSCAAVEKLGARRDGVLRRNRITWTGFVRDTVIYSLLPEEWT